MIGNLYAVPLKNGNYGLAQTILKDTEADNGTGMMLGFDIQLSLNELKTFNYAKIYGLRKIFIIPLLMTASNLKSAGLEVILGNIPPVLYDAPLFSLNSQELTDFYQTYYRSVSSYYSKNTAHYYTCAGQTTLAGMLERYYSAGTPFREFNDIDSDEYLFNAEVTDRDMKVNPHEYNQWGMYHTRTNGIKALEEAPLMMKKLQEILREANK